MLKIRMIFEEGVRGVFSPTPVLEARDHLRFGVIPNSD